MTEKEIEFIYQTVGSEIKKARISNGMSQEDFANLLGLSRASIVNIEAGRQRPSLHLLFEISRKTQTKIEDFLPKIPDEIVVSNKLESQIRSYSDGNEKTEEVLTKFLNQINSLKK